MDPKSKYSPLCADLIFSNDLSHYISWQERCCPDFEPGWIRDALEYHQFLEYCNAFIGGSLPELASDGSQLASKCNHTRHPSDIIMHDLCPMCEVAVHLLFMRTIAIAWYKAGGPSLGPNRYPTTKSYGALRKGWHTARLHLQDLLDMFEVMATYEGEWEIDNPSGATAARKTNCASAAIKIGQEESRYPARLSPPNKQTRKKSNRQRNNSVTFSPQVQIKNGEQISTSTTKSTNSRP